MMQIEDYINHKLLRKSILKSKEFKKYKSRFVKLPEFKCGIDEFAKEFRINYTDEIKNSPPLWIVNNTTTDYKTQEYFNCPTLIPIDIDFHGEDNLKYTEFLSDTKTKSIDDFIYILSKDKFCILGGLSKSQKGIRLLFNVETQYSITERDQGWKWDIKTNINVHESNFDFVSNYLNENYGVKPSYIDECTKSIQQGTYPIHLQGSFYNEDFILMYNPFIEDNDIEVKTEKEFEYKNDTFNYTIEYLEELYNGYSQLFKEAFKSHMPTMYKLKFILFQYDNTVLSWFYNKIKSDYKGTSMINTLKDFNSFKKFFCNDPKQPKNLKWWFVAIGIQISTSTNIEEINFTEIIDEANTIDLNFAPYIPNEIYDDLPKIIRDITDEYSGRDRDILLTSILGVIAPIFSNVSSNYFKGLKIYNNLFFFIVSTSGAGKGIMSLSLQLLQDIEAAYKEEYDYKLKEYLQLDENEKRKVGEPKLKSLIFAGDSSSAGLKEEMVENEGVGLIFETEGETLSSNKKEKWGDNSLIIRKSLQNESMSGKRVKQNKSVIDIPRINIVSSGTFNQITKVIGNDGIEDGTYSRFIFYIFKSEIKWSDPFTNENISDVFRKSSLLLKQYKEEKFDHKNFIFKLSDNQKKIFNTYFSNQLDDSLLWGDDSISSVLFRHGLFAIKLMITIACLRACEWNKDTNNLDLFSELNYIIKITDDDFNLVLNLIKIYFSHSSMLFNSYDKKEIEIKKSWKEITFNNLPDKFDVPAALKLSPKSESITRHWLSEMVKKKILRKEGKLLYFKCNNPSEK